MPLAGAHPATMESTFTTPVDSAEAELGLAAPDTTAQGVSFSNINDILAAYDGTTGYETLLDLWGISYDPASGTACAQAEAEGLSCYFQRGTWNSLEQLDRPVILTLTMDGMTHEVALVGLTGDVARLATANGTEAVPLDDLADFWFGQFLIVWRPPNGVAAPIGPGMQNEDVRWLRQSLASLNSNFQAEAGTPNLFDSELEAEVASFQRKHRLEADGLAGQKTQIIINSLLAVDGTPRLTSHN